MGRLCADLTIEEHVWLNCWVLCFSMAFVFSKKVASQFCVDEGELSHEQSRQHEAVNTVLMFCFQTAGLGTMARLAFACQYQPGSADETPLADLFAVPLARPICYGFNSVSGCSDPSVKMGSRCQKGFHVCGSAKCGHKVHPLSECTGV